MADILLDVKVVGSQDVLKAERALVKVQNSAKRLASEMDRGRMSSQAYFKGQTQLIRVLTRAGFSYEEARKSVFRYTKSMRASEVAVDQTTQSIQRATIAQQNMAAATNRNSRGIGRMSTITQQTGYQVGDFIVQVQSGTNAFVAFGQQATQVAGTLTLLGGKMVLIGSVLGVAIPLMTALGAAFMRTRESTKKAEDSIESLDSALGSVKTSFERAGKPIRDLAKDFGDFADEVQRASRIAAQASVSDALRNLQGASTQLRSDLSSFRKDFGVFRGELEAYNIVSDSLGERTISNASAFDQAEKSLEQARKSMRRAAEDIGLTTTQALDLDSALKNLDRADSMKGVATSASQTLDLIDSMFTSTQTIPPEVSKIVSELEAVLRAAALGQKAMEDSSDSAEDFKNTIDSTSISGLAAQAGLLASNMGVAASEAVKYNTALNKQAGIPDDTGKPRLGFGLPSVDAGRETGTGFSRLGFGDLDERPTRNLIPQPTTSGGSSPSGGGSAEKVQEDYLKKLQLEADRKLKLSKLSEEEARIKEITFQLIDKGLPIEQGRIEAIVATEEALRKATEAEKQREQLMNTIEGHISNAFMTMVDGSKSVEDAFKGMLRNILLEVYKQQVAEPAAAGIGSLLSKGLSSVLPSAKGNVISGGEHVTAYADGGVVNRATMFPMRGGMGLMGEAGPEAIMPLKRGSNGKLGVQMEGGQQPVVVNQTFHFQANGDESVKRIIGQSMPQIAQYTTKTIVDERRKGGSMKAAFRG